MDEMNMDGEKRQLKTEKKSGLQIVQHAKVGKIEGQKVGKDLKKRKFCGTMSAGIPGWPLFVVATPKSKKGSTPHEETFSSSCPSDGTDSGLRCMSGNYPSR